METGKLVALGKLEAFSLLSENYRLNLDNVDYCEFEERKFTFKKGSEEYFVTSTRQLLCEPQICLMGENPVTLQVFKRRTDQKGTSIFCEENCGPSYLQSPVLNR